MEDLKAKWEQRFNVTLRKGHDMLVNTHTHVMLVNTHTHTTCLSIVNTHTHDMLVNTHTWKRASTFSFFSFIIIFQKGL